MRKFKFLYFLLIIGLGVSVLRCNSKPSSSSHYKIVIFAILQTSRTAHFLHGHE